MVPVLGSPGRQNELTGKFWTTTTSPAPHICLLSSPAPMRTKSTSSLGNGFPLAVFSSAIFLKNILRISNTFGGWMRNNHASFDQNKHCFHNFYSSQTLLRWTFVQCHWMLLFYLSQPMHLCISSKFFFYFTFQILKCSQFLESDRNILEFPWQLPPHNLHIHLHSPTHVLQRQHLIPLFAQTRWSLLLRLRFLCFYI